MKKQTIAQILLITILAQSCVAYKNTAISLDQAIDQGRVKVISKEGRKTRLQSISKENGNYYGVLPKENVVFPLESTSLVAIYKYDQKKSRIQTAVLIGGITLGLAFILGVSVANSIKNTELDIDMSGVYWDW